MKKYTNKVKNEMNNTSHQMLPMRNGSGVVQRNTVSNDVIRIYFTDEGIGGSSQHLEELEAINSAGAGDIIYIHMVGCPGGDGNTTMAIINAIISSPAHTVCVIEGHNASAGSIIPMVCSEVVVTPYCSLMCHTGHGGEYGTIMNKARSATFRGKLYHSWLADVYEGFLTEEELKMIFDGLEIYLDSEEIQERLDRRATLMAAEAEEEDCCHSVAGSCETCVEDVIHKTEVIMEVVGDTSPSPEKKAPAKKASPKKQK